jgi:hypothetical protein
MNNESFVPCSAGKEGLGRVKSITAHPTSQKKQSAHHSHWICAPYSVAPSQPGVPAREDNCFSTL